MATCNNGLVLVTNKCTEVEMSCILGWLVLLVLIDLLHISSWETSTGPHSLYILSLHHCGLASTKCDYCKQPPLLPHPPPIVSGYALQEYNK